MNDIQEALSVAEKIARAVRQAAAPLLDDISAGDVTGVASSGDTTFLADVAAEAALARAVTSTGMQLACYSEDQGLVQYGASPRWLLIVDPIDGTRPASAGLETCAVSVAVARWTGEPVFSDVVAGAVYELRRDRLYLAAAGNGATVILGDRRFPLAARAPAEPGQLRWTLEVVGRPSEINLQATAGLIDATALRGGFYVMNSSAFSLCQVAEGRLSGMVDISGRLLREIPDALPKFQRLGNGKPMGLWAYDIAAAAVIAREAGCVVTNAWGNSLDDTPLTRTGPEDMASCVCAADSDLHSWMMDALEQGFARCLSGQAGSTEADEA